METYVYLYKKEWRPFLFWTLQRSPSKTNEMWENLKTQQEHWDKAKEERSRSNFMQLGLSVQSLVVFLCQVEFHLPVIVEVHMNRSLMNGCYKRNKKAQKEATAFKKIRSPTHQGKLKHTKNSLSKGK